MKQLLDEAAELLNLYAEAMSDDAIGDELPNLKRVMAWLDQYWDLK